jgi:hypothetical protein
MSGTIINIVDKSILDQHKAYEAEMIGLIDNLVGRWQVHQDLVLSFLVGELQPSVASSAQIPPLKVSIHMIRTQMAELITQLRLLQVKTCAYAHVKNLGHGHRFMSLIDKVSGLPDLPKKVVIENDPVVNLPTKQQMKEFIGKEDWYAEGDWDIIFPNII